MVAGSMQNKKWDILYKKHNRDSCGGTTKKLHQQEMFITREFTHTAMVASTKRYKIKEGVKGAAAKLAVEVGTIDMERLAGGTGNEQNGEPCLLGLAHRSLV